MIQLMKQILYATLVLLLITACGDDDDDDNNDIGSGDNTDMGLSLELPESIVDTSFVLAFTTANEGAPYELDQEVKFSFQENGDMEVDIDPDMDNGNELTLSNPQEVGSEIVWMDQENGFDYSLSLTVDGSINEINVSSNSSAAFLGQFTVVDSDDIALTLSGFVGTYSVTSVDLGEHSRNTVIVDDQGNIDFDDDKQAIAADIVESNDVVLIDGAREIILRYPPYPTEPYVEIIIDFDSDSGEIIAMEYRTVESPSLDRFKVALSKN